MLQTIRRKDFLNQTSMNTEDMWLRSVKPEHGFYIAGFVDGEGSFNVSLRKRTDHRLGWQVVSSFNVSQKDRVILAFLKKIFGCGTLRTRKDGVVYYEVTNIDMLNRKIIPFFERFGFLSANKKRNFSIFKQIVSELAVGPLTKDILKRVVDLRESLNKGIGRKRKYTKNHIQV